MEVEKTELLIPLTKISKKFRWVLLFEGYYKSYPYLRARGGYTEGIEKHFRLFADHPCVRGFGRK